MHYKRKLTYPFPSLHFWCKGNIASKGSPSDLPWTVAWQTGVSPGDRPRCASPHSLAPTRKWVFRISKHMLMSFQCALSGCKYRDITGKRPYFEQDSLSSLMNRNATLQHFLFYKDIQVFFSFPLWQFPCSCFSVFLLNFWWILYSFASCIIIKSIHCILPPLMLYELAQHMSPTYTCFAFYVVFFVSYIHLHSYAIMTQVYFCGTEDIRRCWTLPQIFVTV